MRITRLASALLVVAASALPAAPLGAQAPTPAVAVVSFNVHEARRDAHEYDGVGSAIADLLASDLHERAGVRILDRAAIRRTVALQPPSRTGMVGREGALDAARLLGAQHVIFGGFTADASGNVRLDARAVNVGSGAVEFTDRLQGRGDDVVALLHELAARLSTGMSLASTGSATPGAVVPLHALADYGRALDAIDRGDRAQARQLLEGVLRDHPDFAPAKAALAAAPDR